MQLPPAPRVLTASIPLVAALLCASFPQLRRVPISSPGGGGENPVDLTPGPAGDSRFYFRATDVSMPAGVFRLFSFTGYPSGALALPVAMPAAATAVDSVGGPLWAHSGVLYAGASLGSTGSELYRVVPSLASGVQLAIDLIPGNSSSAPANFASVGGLFVFTAGTAVNAVELWMLAGSAQVNSRGVQPALVSLNSWAALGGTLPGVSALVPLGSDVLFLGQATAGAAFGLWRITAVAPSVAPSPSGIPPPSNPPAGSPVPVPPTEGPAGELEMTFTMLRASVTEVTAPVALALEDGIAAALGIVSGGWPGGMRRRCGPRPRPPVSPIPAPLQPPWDVLIEPATPLNGQPIGISMLLIIAVPAVNTTYGERCVHARAPPLPT